MSEEKIPTSTRASPSPSSTGSPLARHWAVMEKVTATSSVRSRSLVTQHIASVARHENTLMMCCLSKSKKAQDNLFISVCCALAEPVVPILNLVGHVLVSCWSRVVTDRTRVSHSEVTFRNPLTFEVAPRVRQETIASIRCSSDVHR